MKAWVGGIVAFLILACALVLAGGGVDRDSAGRPAFGRAPLSIVLRNGSRVSFSAEVARTEREQEYGLMFLRDLPEDQAMIFPYAPPREVAFWMKNTFVSLDMLFVRPDGTVGGIVERTVPEDLTLHASDQPVSAVVEIRGGLAAEKGISIGDKVVSSALTKMP